MIALYIILSIVALIFVGSIMPIVQYFYIRRRQSQKNYVTNAKYVYGKELIDFDYDGEYNQTYSRAKISNRGWVRGETVFDNEEYEKMRKEEFDIELP